ncbi:MAG: hypothetical protein E5X48_04515 [Mesorhizobium sp.]|nr:MAG: hypothetical protein E5X48_04515 [Mesorhizobium sp.]
MISCASSSSRRSHPTAYCLLPTAYCLLPTAYCLIPLFPTQHRSPPAKPAYAPRPQKWLRALWL